MWDVLLHVLCLYLYVGVCFCCSRSWCTYTNSGISRWLCRLSVSVPAHISAVTWVVLAWIYWQQDGKVVVNAQIAS